MIWAGTDPVQARAAERAAHKLEAARSITFAEAAEKFIAKKAPEFGSERYLKMYRSELERHALPGLGDVVVDQITRADVLRVLGPIWTERTATAKKLRGKIESVLDWAAANGFREGPNPAAWRGNLEHDLASPTKLIQAKSQHQPAVQLRDAPDWYADLRGRDGIATRALEWVALTACRSGEARGAAWSEIDRAAQIWTVPGERTKTGQEHRVPLTDPMIEILDGLARDSDMLFPAVRGGKLSDMALSACMRRINEARAGGYLDSATGRPAVPHGLRSTFRDWCAERGVDHDLAEISLAHRVGSEVERAYRRSDMIERRRSLMASWGGFLRGESGTNVIRIGA